MIAIRSALASDVPVLFQMLRASAADQGFPDALAVTESDLLQDGFGPQPTFRAVIASLDGAPAGTALYFFNYSTWVSRNGLYLEDLYVDPNFRRRGIGRALLDHLWTLAREQGCLRMQWVVHRDNHRAIRLYRSFGARSMDDWLLLTITAPAT